MASPDSSRVTVEQFLLCEGCAVGTSGRPTYRGLVGWIELDKVPAVLEPLVAIVELWGGADAAIPIGFDLLGPDGKLVWRSLERTVPIGPSGSRNYVREIQGVPLARAGGYSLEVKSSGRVLASRPLVARTGAFSIGPADDRPHVLVIALTQSVRQEPSGRPTLVGAFSQIAAAGFPTQHPRAVLALEVWGRRFRRYDLPMRLVGPPGVETVALESASINTRETGLDAFGLEVQGLVFPQAGDYALEILYDGDVIGRRSLRVIASDG